MVSRPGAPLGTGRSCVHSIEGCFPFTPCCRQRVDATFTLDFARGRIAAVTGDFAGARGRVVGGGAGAFTDQGFVGKIAYAVALKG